MHITFTLYRIAFTQYLLQLNIKTPLSLSEHRQEHMKHFIQ